MTQKHEILFSRIASAVLALGALAIALYIKSAYDVLMFAWAFYAAAAGLPALAALYWKKPRMLASLPAWWAALLSR